MRMIGIIIDKPSEHVNFKKVLMKSVTVHWFNIMFIVFVVWKSTDLFQRYKSISHFINIYIANETLTTFQNSSTISALLE